MLITWKDALATTMVGTSGIIVYAKVKGFSWPLLGSWRSAALVLLIIGLATCIIVGSGLTPVKNGWTTSATVLGVTAFIFAIAGIIFNSKLAFLGLAADIFALWLLTTIHHLTLAGN